MTTQNTIPTSFRPPTTPPVRKRLNATLDVVFKLLMADAGNTDLLISLLTAVLRPKSPIVAVEVLNPELPKSLVDDKGSVLDLHVKLADGRHTDVEMQIRVHPALRSRALFYWAKMYAGQLGLGGLYPDLKPCVSVFILGERELPEGRFHSIFRVLDVNTKEQFSDQLEMHFVQLPDLPSQFDELDKLLHDWGRFFRGRDADLEELAMGSPVFAKALTFLDMLSAEPSVRELAEQRELAQRNYLSGLDASHRQGRIEGRVEGLVEGREETLLAVIAARGLKVSDEQRDQISRCQDQATFDKWITRVVSCNSVAELLADDLPLHQAVQQTPSSGESSA